MTHYLTYTLSLQESSTGARTMISVDQPYEPIHIAWNGGYIDVVPPAVFEIEDGRTCLNKFRKLLRLSAISDLENNTNTLSAWRKAIHADYDFMIRLNNIIAEQHKLLFDELVDEAKTQDSHRGGKLRRLHKRCGIELRRIESRRKRLNKCLEALETTVKKIRKGRVINYENQI